MIFLVLYLLCRDDCCLAPLAQMNWSQEVNSSEQRINIAWSKYMYAILAYTFKCKGPVRLQSRVHSCLCWETDTVLLQSMSPSTRKETSGTRGGMLFWWGADCAGGCRGFRGERLKMQPFFVNTQWPRAEQALAVLAAAGSLPSLRL